MTQEIASELKTQKSMLLFKDVQVEYFISEARRLDMQLDQNHFRGQLPVRKMHSLNKKFLLFDPLICC